MTQTTTSEASTIIFINDALTTPRIWDPLIANLKIKHNIIIFDIYQTSPNPTLSHLQSSLQKCIATAHATSTPVHILALGIGAVLTLTLLASPPNFSRPARPKIASFTAISFELASFAPEARLIGEVWAERFPLAQKWGMGITADKACARWMDHSLRGSEAWGKVRGCVFDIPIEEFVGMGKVVAELYAPLRNEGRKGGVVCIANTTLLERVKVPCLFVAGAGDAVLPEEMERYAGCLGEGVRGESRSWTVEGAGRLPWWEGDARGEFVEGLKSWIGHHEGR